METLRDNGVRLWKQLKNIPSEYYTNATVKLKKNLRKRKLSQEILYICITYIRIFSRYFCIFICNVINRSTVYILVKHTNVLSLNMTLDLQCKCSGHVKLCVYDQFYNILFIIVLFMLYVCLFTELHDK